MEYANPVMTMPVTTAGDGYNGNNWMNNPFAYLIWIYALRNFGFGNGVDAGALGGADRAGQILNASQVDAIRETVGRILSDVQCGNANGMRFLELCHCILVN